MLCGVPVERPNQRIVSLSVILAPDGQNKSPVRSNTKILARQVGTAPLRLCTKSLPIASPLPYPDSLYVNP